MSERKSTDIDALIEDVLEKHDIWQKFGSSEGRAYRVAAANAAPTLAIELKRCREALTAGLRSMETAMAFVDRRTSPKTFAKIQAGIEKCESALTPKEPAHDQR